jgi:hypothetical protein
MFMVLLDKDQDPPLFVRILIRIRMHHTYLGLLDPAFSQQAKKVRKTLISPFLLLIFDFLSVNVPSKINKQKM